MATNTNKCQCSVTWCSAEAKHKGFCGKHYKQMYRHGKVFKTTRNDFNEIVDKGRYYELIMTDNEMNETGRAKIDKEDLNKVKKAASRWSLDKNGYVKNSKNGLYMHRVVMEAEDHELIDHRKAGFKYKRDNRKKNLRICTESDNRCNTIFRKDNRSGVKGVDYHEKRQQWRARVQYKGVVKNLGWFKTKEAAMSAREKAAKKIHNEFYNEGREQVVL